VFETRFGGKTSNYISSKKANKKLKGRTRILSQAFFMFRVFHFIHDVQLGLPVELFFLGKILKLLQYYGN